MSLVGMTDLRDWDFQAATSLCIWSFFLCLLSQIAGVRTADLEPYEVPATTKYCFQPSCLLALSLDEYKDSVDGILYALLIIETPEGNAAQS